MKILILLIIFLQISCILTCFTSASRKKLRSTWEIQCKHGVKNGNGRQAALARAIPCLLFSVTKEWSREKREIQQDAVSELKDIVVFLNDEEIKSMVQSEEVHATISVEFDNGTYFVKVLEADNIVGPNAFRIKRHAVGTPFDVSLQICEQSCVPSYGYGGKSLDDNGQIHVQLAGLPYGKRRHYTAKPRVPASKPVTSTVRQNSTKATTTTTTSTTSTSTTTTTTTTTSTTTTTKATTTTKRPSTKSSTTAITTKHPSTKASTTAITTKRPSTKASTTASTKKNETLSSNNEAPDQINSSKATPTKVEKTDNSSNLGEDSDLVETSEVSSVNAMPYNKQSNKTSAPKTKDTAATTTTTSEPSAIRKSHDSPNKVKGNKQDFNKIPSKTDMENLQHKIQPSVTPFPKWILGLVGIPTLLAPMALCIFLWRSPNILSNIIRCFNCGQRRQSSIEMAVL